MNKIIVFCENTQKNYTIKIGLTLTEFRDIVYPDKDKENDFDTLGALVNNELNDLQYVLMEARRINFITASSLDGYSIYARSLVFLLYKAVRMLYPKKNIVAEHNISNGIFCKIPNRDIVCNAETIALIKDKMQEIVKASWEIVRKDMPTDYAIKLFTKNGLKDKINLLTTRGRLYTSVYYINNEPDYFFGTLAPNTACLSVFDLVPYKDGMLLVLPNRDNPSQLLPVINQDKIFHVYSEFKRWGKIMDIANIGDYNTMIDNGQAGNVIKVSEALQEKKISMIADKIRERRKKVKVILIAGPSSSGKTTFGKRLSIQLAVNGIRPINLSLDNYFVNRDQTPKDENGDLDFETIDALDIKTFSDNIIRLLNGEEVEIPKFSFETGNRYYDGEKIKMNKENMIVIEGIHGLNPKMTAMLPSDSTFKIFVSALTSISIDSHNIINPTDNRLIRRMVRDYKYRHYSAVDTLKRWESVMKGEQLHIVPYQEEADAVFNSALFYELGALKSQAEPLLRDVKEIMPEHSKALRLLKFFSYIKSIPIDEIPPTSLLREFLGGSSFDY